MTDSDDFLNAGIDSLGGADADSDPSIGATPEQIDQLESETRNVSPETPLEDMSGNDSAIGKNSSDTTAAKSLTGWHPFMRFLFRVADMKYAYVTPREKRAYLFISRHKKTFWACFWGGIGSSCFQEAWASSRQSSSRRCARSVLSPDRD